MSASSFGLLLTFILAVSLPVLGYRLHLRLEAKRQQYLADLAAQKSTDPATPSKADKN